MRRIVDAVDTTVSRNENLAALAPMKSRTQNRFSLRSLLFAFAVIAAGLGNYSCVRDRFGDAFGHRVLAIALCIGCFVVTTGAASLAWQRSSLGGLLHRNQHRSRHVPVALLSFMCTQCAVLFDTPLSGYVAAVSTCSGLVIHMMIWFLPPAEFREGGVVVNGDCFRWDDMDAAIVERRRETRLRLSTDFPWTPWWSRKRCVISLQNPDIEPVRLLISEKLGAVYRK